MVIERRRPKGQNDHLRYFCENCGEILYDPEFYLTNIVKQLKPLMDTFWVPAPREPRSFGAASGTVPIMAEAEEVSRAGPGGRLAGRAREPQAG